MRQAALQHDQPSYENFRAIHNDSQGIICVSQVTEGKWKNKYGRYAAMLNYMDNLESQDDIFFSQNTFKKFKRSTEHLLELKALYLDLDYYNKTGYTQEQVLGNIELLVKDGKIPCPTHIIESGHGLNIIWRIKRTPAQALPLWRTIEEYLYGIFEHLGADRKALDVTRVFRPEGTYNAKYPQKNKVSIYYSCPLEYDIHLIQQYVQFDSSSKSKKNNQRRTIVHLYNQYSLYYSRYIDILTICKLRDYDVEGYREVILFLYRYYGCAYLQDPELALNNALELNAKFKKPLPEQKVITATRSAEKAAKSLKYGYRNKTLINMLDISDDEMQATYPNGDYYLKTIISTEEKYRRNNKRRYDALRDQKGKTEEENRQDNLLEQIKTLRAKGLTQHETAKKLGINVRTVQRYERKIQEEKKLLPR